MDGDRDRAPRRLLLIHGGSDGRIDECRVPGHALPSMYADVVIGSHRFDRHRHRISRRAHAHEEARLGGLDDPRAMLFAAVDAYAKIDSRGEFEWLLQESLDSSEQV